MVRSLMNSPVLGLLAPTRKALVLGLKERGEATAEVLGVATYLSVAAVRAHLTALERLGIVSHTNQRNGPGRPLHIYRLTPAGETLFPQSYAPLLRAVFDAVADDRECEAKIMRFVEQAQVFELQQHVRAPSVGGRLRELVRAPTFAPFFPEYEQTAERTWCLRFRHCPLKEVASEYAQCCELEQRVVQVALGESATVEVQSRMTDGSPVCAFNVRSGG